MASVIDDTEPGIEMIYEDEAQVDAMVNCFEVLLTVCTVVVLYVTLIVFENSEVIVTITFKDPSEENGLVTADHVPPTSSSKVIASIGHLVGSFVLATFAEPGMKVTALVPEESTGYE